MNSDNKSDPNYLKIIQPQLLIWILLTYSIGVGLARHQGGQLDWVNILFGAFLGFFLILMRMYLSAFYDHPSSPVCGLHPDDPRYEQLKRLDRQILLIIALTLLTAGALDTVLLMVRHALNLPVLLIIGITFAINFFSVVPPVQLERKGYGEVTEAILISNLIPAIGYLLIKMDVQVLLIMVTLPLTLLYIAQRIILSLETFAFDRTHRVQSLVVRLDWQKAMQVHNYLILLSFLFVGIFALIGLPWSLTWPMFLPLLIGIFQIIQILGIMTGAPPRWKLIKLTATSTFVVMAYLISFTLWIT